MSGYTSGSWKVIKDYGCEEGKPDELELVFHSIRTESGEIIASTWGRPHEANAHLIAAAPDMYEALENLLDVLPDGEWSNTKAEIVGVITKARGDK